MQARIWIYVSNVIKVKFKMILTNFRKRVLCDIDVEFVEAKKQVKKIASLRINELMKK